MKIRTQFKLFLLGVIAVPIFCLLSILIVHYMTAPNRYIIKGYKQARAISKLPISERDTKILDDVMHFFPPHAQFILVENHTNIIFSNIPEFRDVKHIEESELFDYMKETGKDYFYQYVSPSLEDTDKSISVITRVRREQDHEKKDPFEKMIYYVVIFMVAFEAFCITIIIHMSMTISRSIVLLEENTKRIANGEVDLEIDQEQDSKTNNEITMLAENFNKMRLTIKENSVRRSKFIMGISHDLRTPVAVIKGYTEAMADGLCSDPEEFKKTLNIISSKTEQLESMIDTLISFVKLNQTEWQQNLKCQELKPILDEFAQTSISTGGLFKRQVFAEINLPASIKIPLDKVLVNRVLENLFTNAVRYSKENDTIRIKANQENDEIKIIVEDTGIGIAKKDIEKIFDLFYRATASRQEEGMGIGLSVVKTIITNHGWKIDVKSQEGVGSAFIITIPLKKEIK
ncbi:HAMP domain-containing sensor histidine kinase [Treponema zioleckii]|uniref:HAMP domain-containing sensor histidine kinase n=1 Tax=Treponema zioleckii TaxID=331680 RepID=UPI00168BEC50|nr:HAMP domain-containing sensor histidine kinase [Treponema zioleckii]